MCIMFTIGKIQKVLLLSIVILGSEQPGVQDDDQGGEGSSRHNYSKSYSTQKDLKKKKKPGKPRKSQKTAKILLFRLRPKSRGFK